MLQDQNEIDRERKTLLQQLQASLEVPMLLLGLVWMALFVIELAYGLTPFLTAVGYVIWGIFLLEFMVNLFLSPRKLIFLRDNWLSVIALLAPALRALRAVAIFRATRVARSAGAVRGLRVLRLLTTINRGMNALSATMKRRGFGYVIIVTVMVTFAGAAAMFSFERDHATGSGGLDSYGTALWWTAMIMTTMGSQYWPQSAEGRLLCFFLSLYSFSVFGYVTATLASFFIGRDAENEEAEVASAKSIAGLREEVAALRAGLEGRRPRPAAEPANTGDAGGKSKDTSD